MLGMLDHGRTFRFVSPSSAERDYQLWFRESAEHRTYQNVPPTVYEKLLTAGSKGRYYELMIRGRHPSERR
jgi:KTSC domain